MISIMENADQSFIMKHGRLWDGEIDTYSSYVYEAKTFWAVGMVWAVYYE